MIHVLPRGAPRKRSQPKKKIATTAVVRIIKKCKNCKLRFAPDMRIPSNAERQEFCCRKCKDHYHRNGGMTFPRLIEVATRAILKNLIADDRLIQTIADKAAVQRESGALQALEARLLAQIDANREFAPIPTGAFDATSTRKPSKVATSQA